ncbi:MAG: galactose mutarotase, partial [Pseudomonadota bacterium]|nr:galactose mutarotase [Pseudomonadota bacterium]
MIGPVSRRPFGSADGKPVFLYTLSAGDGMTARITNYGATLTALHVPDRHGRPADMVLGFDALDGYLRGCPYFGATVGRFANRIDKGQFRLDGRLYALTVNDGENHLHGGRKGFDKVVWDAEETDGSALTLRYVAADGEEGYPGTLTATVRFALTGQGELAIEMTAATDRPTLVNLAHHSYWNLSGRPQENVLDHELTINADRYTPAGPQLIPTGEIAPVAGTAYDFRTAKPVGRDRGKLPSWAAGYDVN